MLADVLGVGIGLFLIYLLLSLIGSTVIEWFSNQLGWRSKLLKRWLVQSLSSDGKSLAERIYDHPLLRILKREKRANLPARIPPRWFAFALIDVVRARSNLPFPSDAMALRKEIAESSVAKPELRDALLLIIDQAGSDASKAVDCVAQWFDDAMLGLRDAYRALIEQRIFFFALIVAWILNLDTVMMGSILWKDFEVRSAFKMVASDLIEKMENTEGRSQEVMEAARAIVELSKRDIPIGWSRLSGDPRSIPNSAMRWVIKCLGIMATSLAASLGAPFWFDLLRKIVGVERGLRQPALAGNGI